MLDYLTTAQGATEKAGRRLRMTVCLAAAIQSNFIKPIRERKE